VVNGCAQGCTGVHTTGVRRDTQEYCTRGYTGVHRGTQGYKGAHGVMHTQGTRGTHYTVLHRGTQGYTLHSVTQGVYTGYTAPGYTGVHSGTQGYTGIDRGTQGYTGRTGVLRGTQGDARVHRGTQGYTGIYSGTYTGVHRVHRGTQGHTGVCIHRGAAKRTGRSPCRV